MSTDRRKHPRKNAGLNRIIPARVEREDADDEAVQLFLVDVSEGGMRINVDRELPDRQNLRVSFSLAEQAENANLCLPCQVVWKRDLVGGTWVHGVEFVELSEGEQDQIRSLVVELDGRHGRRHYRLHRLLPMAIRIGEDEWMECYAGDLSAEGVGLTLETLLPEEEDIQIRLFPEFGLPPIHATARVAWNREAGERQRYGLRFAAIDEISAQVIGRYIERCLEGFM